MTKQEITYPVVFIYQHEKGKGDYIAVDFPDFKKDGGYTSGDTYEEAIANAKDVLTLVATSRIDDGEELPKPSRIDDVRYESPLDEEDYEVVTTKKLEIFNFTISI